MAGLPPTRRRAHRHSVDSGAHSRGRVTSVHASRREPCESTEPSTLFGNAAPPLDWFQEGVLESLSIEVGFGSKGTLSRDSSESSQGVPEQGLKTKVFTTVALRER